MTKDPSPAISHLINHHILHLEGAFYLEWPLHFFDPPLDEAHRMAWHHRIVDLSIHQGEAVIRTMFSAILQRIVSAFYVSLIICLL